MDPFKFYVVVILTLTWICSFLTCVKVVFQ